MTHVLGAKSNRERGPMQCDQHTVKTFVTQHEDSKDAKGPQESAERGVVPD